MSCPPRKESRWPSGRCVHHATSSRRYCRPEKRARSEERRVGKERKGTRSKRDWSSDVCSSDLTICENIIHPRRCPRRLNRGKSTRSIKGAHRNFHEYVMPTQERKPMAVREVCSSRNQ